MHAPVRLCSALRRAKVCACPAPWICEWSHNVLDLLHNWLTLFSPHWLCEACLAVNLPACLCLKECMSIRHYNTWILEWYLIDTKTLALWVVAGKLNVNFMLPLMWAMRPNHNIKNVSFPRHVYEKNILLFLGCFAPTAKLSSNKSFTIDDFAL